MVTALASGILLSALIGTPLLAVLGLLAALYFVEVAHVPLQAMITQVKIVMEAPGLLALPIFTFMGYILTYSKASQRLADLSSNWLGWLPGGLAIATVIAYTVFSALTGGSALAVMALGGIYYSALMKAGYDKNFALGTCTVCGGEGMLFPPSLPIIVIGFISYQAIDELYVAGLLPGITVTAVFIVYCIIHAYRLGIPSSPFHWKPAIASLKAVALEAPLPFFIIVAIFAGWMSVPEVAIVSLLYIFITQVLIRREVTIPKVIEAGTESLVLVGAIFAILVSALTFSNFLIDQQIPQHFLEFLLRVIKSRLVFLLFLNFILLITGSLMDVFSAILVMVPLLLPVSTGYGIDPVHFCIIFLWNLELGYSTPPIGFNLFIGAFRFREPLEVLFRAVLPRLLVQAIGLILIAYWPDLTLWLPTALGMKKELIPLGSSWSGV